MAQTDLTPRRIVNLAAAPGSPAKGWLYFDTGTNKTYYWNGTSWIDMTGGGGGAFDLLETIKWMD
jgi:hypothetical protein